MKKLLILCLCCLTLTACKHNEAVDETSSATQATASAAVETEITSAPTEETTEPAGTESDTAETTEATTEILMVYSPDNNLEGFLRTEYDVSEVNEHSIISALIEAGVLTEGVEANSSELDGTELRVDLNAAFRDLILSQGTSGERAVIGSLVNTFLDAYEDAETVFLTVDGEILESGHVVYDFQLEFYK